MARMTNDGFYRGYNSGFFADAYRSLAEKNNQLPLGEEKVIAEEIRSCLARGESEPVVLVELGAQTGGSLSVLAKSFRPQIEAGMVQLIAINKERRGITALLDGTAKRLRERNVVGLMLPDQRSVDFVREQSPFIRWKSGVDVENLPKLVKRADIFHERTGALYHAKDGKKALQAIIEILKPGGLLTTDQEIDHMPAQYGDFPKDALIPEKYYRWGREVYYHYRKKE